MSLCGLDRAAALGRLAQIFYYARGEFFDLDVVHWEALSAYEQHIHVAYVMTCLEGLPAAVTTPSLGADDAPLQSGDVGEGRTSPGRYFEVAADLSRAAGAKLLAFRGLDDSDGRD